MDGQPKEINRLLVLVYQSIGRLEEHMLRKDSGFDLSISEIHFLETVGDDSERYPLGKTVSELAQALDITLPSVTLAANKLIRKGFLVKEKSARDGRVAHINLTREGQKIYRLHRLFHLKMVSGVMEGMTKEELGVLMSGLRKLNDFLMIKVTQT
ncbi:MAG: MarR family transcriptional regulator [Oscillospiraceae bacterium]|nr:MarR family transcriptional regulator [Oscillospiraceae bacterium]